MLLGGDPDVCLVIINGRAEDVGWTLPRIGAGQGWLVGIDTSQAEEPQTTPPWRDPVYQVRAGSLALLRTTTLIAGELEHGTTTHEP